MGFFSKYKELNGQNVMCTECFLKTLHGYNIVQEKLNFYAYQLKSGKDSESIYHYVIPIIQDEKLLRRAIELIGKAKEVSDANHYNSINNQILNLNAEIDSIKRRLKSVSSEEKKDLSKKKSDYEKRKREFEKNLSSPYNRLDIEIFFDEFSKVNDNISLLDIYYKITNVKQNPKIIEIVSDILLTSEMIKKLARVFNKTKNRYGLIRLSDLKNLMDDRYFLGYYSALLSLNQISKKLFNKHTAETIKKYFLRDYLKLKNTNLNERLKYYNLLEQYDRFLFMFGEANLWRNE